MSPNRGWEARENHILWTWDLSLETGREVP